MTTVYLTYFDRLLEKAKSPLITLRAIRASGSRLLESRFPPWIRVPSMPRDSPSAEAALARYKSLKEDLGSLKLQTVCVEAKCPNVSECWGGGTATVMLLGDECTRGCRFCAVKTKKCPSPPDVNEPENVAASVAKWGLDYVVLTMVDRDDLPDQGSAHVAQTIRKILEKKPEILVEALVGDFQGKLDLVDVIVDSGLHVYAHNIETVERLTPSVRDRRAAYRQTLKVLEYAKKRIQAQEAERPSGVKRLTKTSLMLGFGETEAEVVQTMKDLRDVDVDVITFGQYLQPTKYHMKVSEFVHPDIFEKYKKLAEEMGFAYCASGPMVRSSYRAGEFYMRHLINGPSAQASDSSSRGSSGSANVQ